VNNTNDEDESSRRGVVLEGQKEGGLEGEKGLSKEPGLVEEGGSVKTGLNRVRRKIRKKKNKEDYH
jgi:hypothetical protein